jgi:hypothetical protein
MGARRIVRGTEWIYDTLYRYNPWVLRGDLIEARRYIREQRSMISILQGDLTMPGRACAMNIRTALEITGEMETMYLEYRESL